MQEVEAELEQAVGAEYTVALKLMEPEFDGERRFVDRELVFVERKLDDLKHLWRPLSLPALGLFRREDWKAYAHRLKHYRDELDKHEREIEDEWLPFQIIVANVGQEDDASVNVNVTVEHGTISEHNRMPERPERLDAGAPGGSKTPLIPRYRGFVRSGVKIGKHAMAAVFSKLEAGTSAELTRQTLYLHYSEHTRLHYEVRSRLVRQQSGKVVV